MTTTINTTIDIAEIINEIADVAISSNRSVIDTKRAEIIKRVLHESTFIPLKFTLKNKRQEILKEFEYYFMDFEEQIQNQLNTGGVKDDDDKPYEPSLIWYYMVSGTYKPVIITYIGLKGEIKNQIATAIIERIDRGIYLADNFGYNDVDCEVDMDLSLPDCNCYTGYGCVNCKTLNR